MADSRPGWVEAGEGEASQDGLFMYSYVCGGGGVS